MLRGRGRKVAIEGFDAAMERQREEARKSWVGSGEAATEAVWFALREEFGATEFLGYDTETAEGMILAILRDGERVAEAEAGDEVGDHRQPDAVLCRIGRAGRRYRGHVLGRTAASSRSRDTVKKAGDLHRPSRHD